MTLAKNTAAGALAGALWFFGNMLYGIGGEMIGDLGTVSVCVRAFVCVCAVVFCSCRSRCLVLLLFLPAAHFPTPLLTD